MIIKAMGLGFVLWLAVAASFRFFGQAMLAPDMMLITLIAAPVLGVAASWLLLLLLREAPGDEGEAAIGVALPALFLNAFAIYAFDTALPNLDDAHLAPFAVWTMLFVASILFMGLSLTRLAAQDERL